MSSLSSLYLDRVTPDRVTLNDDLERAQNTEQPPPQIAGLKSKSVVPVLVQVGRNVQVSRSQLRGTNEEGAIVLCGRDPALGHIRSALDRDCYW